MGDFNALLSSEDKRGGVGFRRSQGHELEQLVSDCSLVDLGFVGPRFTWFWDLLCERLDRAFYNSIGRLEYPDTVVHHLPRIRLDHRPILILTDPNLHPQPTNRPFRFQAAWLSHPGFVEFVHKCWSDNMGWKPAYDWFIKDIREWNRKVFGNIFHRKDMLIRRLQDIEERLARDSGEQLEILRKEVIEEYERTLSQEEALWFQKCRVNWVNFGDRNTPFFSSFYNH